MSFTFSPEALSTLKYFHNAENVLYVEGDDDYSFWQCILNGCNLRQHFKILKAGSCTSLEKYMESIIHFDSQIFVATDRDSSIYCNFTFIHSRIIYSFAYSIENSLYEPKAISEVINLLFHNNEDYTLEVHLFEKYLSDRLFPLITLNAANFYFKKGVGVFKEDIKEYKKTVKEKKGL